MPLRTVALALHNECMGNRVKRILTVVARLRLLLSVSGLLAFASLANRIQAIDGYRRKAVGL